MIKQKTTALEPRNLPRGNNGSKSSNGRFDHYQFGDNVLLDVPHYSKNGDHRIHGLDESQDGVLLRLFIRDRFCDIPVQKCDFSKCDGCFAKTYNSGIEKHLCYDPVMCPAVNPAMTRHETFAPPGYPARIYPRAKEAIDAGTNYA